MYELFKEVFDSFPHIQRIWVNGAGEYFFHPKRGCELVERQSATKPDTDKGEDAPANETRPKKHKK